MNAHSLIFAAKDIIPLVGLYPIAFTNSFVVRCGRKKKCGSLSRGYILQCRLARGGIFFIKLNIGRTEQRAAKDKDIVFSALFLLFKESYESL